MASSQFFNQISDRGLAFSLLYTSIRSSIAKRFAEMDDKCFRLVFIGPHERALTKEVFHLLDPSRILFGNTLCLYDGEEHGLIILYRFAILPCT